MKTIRFVLVGLAAAVALSGCSWLLPDPEIRFDNATTDIQFMYGVRVGTATHLGTLNPGETSEYYVGSPGEYNVEVKNADGIWSAVTDETKSFERGSAYTVKFTGSYGVSLEIFLEED